jgi:ribosomal protein S18 acetylase RimI-like enzyme
MVAVDGSRIVGSVILGWDGWRGHIYRLAVERSYRGAGLGTRLLEAAEHRARDQGCARIDAIVQDENELAHRLWSHVGYQRQTRWSRWVKQLDG